MWLGHLEQRINVESLTRRVEKKILGGNVKKTWEETVKDDINRSIMKFEDPLDRDRFRHHCRLVDLLDSG